MKYSQNSSGYDYKKSFIGYAGIQADKKRKLYNGTLRVDLYQFYGERVKRSAIAQAKEK